MNSDFRDALQCLLDESVRFLVVGGYAVIHYTQPRYTKDLDIWLEPATDNAAAVARAFRRFGLPLIEITEADLAVPGPQFMAGIPPNAIDFITTCSNLEFVSCWNSREIVPIGGLLVPYLSRHDLIAAKQFLGREQDQIDLRLLRHGS
jgi:hypothetical protein